MSRPWKALRSASWPRSRTPTGGTASAGTCWRTAARRAAPRDARSTSGRPAAATPGCCGTSAGRRCAGVRRGRGGGRRRARAVAVVRGDAHRLPVADASLDLVVAFDVLEHIEDDDPPSPRSTGCCAPAGRSSSRCRPTPGCGPTTTSPSTTSAATPARHCRRGAAPRRVRDRGDDVVERAAAPRRGAAAHARRAGSDLETCTRWSTSGCAPSSPRALPAGEGMPGVTLLVHGASAARDRSGQRVVGDEVGGAALHLGVHPADVLAEQPRQSSWTAPTPATATTVDVQPGDGMAAEPGHERVEASRTASTPTPRAPEPGGQPQRRHGEAGHASRESRSILRQRVLRAAGRPLVAAVGRPTSEGKPRAGTTNRSTRWCSGSALIASTVARDISRKSPASTGRLRCPTWCGSAGRRCAAVEPLERRVGRAVGADAVDDVDPCVAGLGQHLGR